MWWDFLRCKVTFSKEGLLKLDKNTYKQIGLEIASKLGEEAAKHIVGKRSPCPVCTGNLVGSHKFRAINDGAEVYVGKDSDPHHIGEPASEYWQDIVMHGASGKGYFVGDYQGDNHPLANEYCVARTGPVDYPKETVKTVVGSNNNASTFFKSIVVDVVKEKIGN